MSADYPNRTPIDDDLEDALQRLIDTTQNLQRRVFRISRRNFITAPAAGQLEYDARAIAVAVSDLVHATKSGK